MESVAYLRLRPISGQSVGFVGSFRLDQLDAAQAPLFMSRLKARFPDTELVRNEAHAGRDPFGVDTGDNKAADLANRRAADVLEACGFPVTTAVELILNAPQPTMELMS